MDNKYTLALFIILTVNAHPNEKAQVQAVPMYVKCSRISSALGRFAHICSSDFSFEQVVSYFAEDKYIRIYMLETTN